MYFYPLIEQRLLLLLLFLYYYYYKYILCVGADSYVDANARNQIQGFHVTLLSVLHTQEWQSS